MDNIRPSRKVLRSPSVKRKSKVLPVNQRVHLERVLGVTVNSNAGLACDSNNGTIAYPAGCVVVLFNPRRNKQSHIFNTCKKTITCLAISPDGKHLVTGETGHQPAVRIWDMAEKTQLAEFHGHKFGINCVAFSPNMKEIVSVGTQHDQMINVWNWRSGLKVASNKVSSKVSSVACSADGRCFVTVGNRHVKFWYLDDKRSKINQTVPLQGRSGILGDQKGNFFCDIVAGVGPQSGSFFVITQSGLLCEFNEKRQLDKWVELRTKTASCLTVGQEHIFVGCGEGVCRVFDASSLHYVCSLPKPHHLGVEVTTATTASAMGNASQGARYPDLMAIAMDDDHKKVTCVYNDRSVYIWDVHDLKRVGKAWSFLYHSGCIWGVEVYPQLEEGSSPCLPPGSFITASGDDTIRVWNLNPHMPEDTAYKRNIYSNELLKIVYSDPTLNSLCNVDYNPAGAADKTDTNYGGKNGVRSIRVSPDGADLASGDRQGNIRIYDMQYLEEKRTIEAHESDVMCLEYTYSPSGRMLATASRDRLIHVFDVDQNYGLIQTLADHSSSVTAVRFTDTDNKLRMISCGADKSILLRNAVTSPDFQFQLEQHLATKITLYDMVIDPTQKTLATACQDRNVRLYNIQTTKEKKCYRGSCGDEGILLRIHLDPSGTYAVTTCTDKNVCILDFHTGEVLATMYGHSEVITGVKFANDLKHVITVSADGCIFVWQLPPEMTAQIKGRLVELGKTMRDTDFLDSDMMANPVVLDDQSSELSYPVMKARSMGNLRMMDFDSTDGQDEEEEDDEEGGPHREVFDDTASQVSLDYRFSIGELPNWAKAKFGSEGESGDAAQEEVNQAKGRWAQRVDRTVEFKSQLDLTISEEDTLSTDRRRTLGGAEVGVSSLKQDIRRETRVLSRSTSDRTLPGSNLLSASTGDLRSALLHPPRRNVPRDASPGLGKFISDHNFQPAKTWTDRYGYKDVSPDPEDTDDLDTGSDTTEVIYPPSNGDHDLFASTYEVFAADSARKRKSKNSVSNLDDASESTDPISLEDEDDPNDDTLAHSAPTTPSDPDKDFLSHTSDDRADFVRSNFEDASFTPVSMDKFTKNLDTLEQQMLKTPIKVDSSTPFSPRLSLSARFMSRSVQPTGSKPFTSLSANIQRSDNWFSRNKMEMSRAMDETRKSLLALTQRDSDPDSPEREDPPSPPTKLEQESSKYTGPASFASSPPTGADVQARLRDNSREARSSLSSSASSTGPPSSRRRSATTSEGVSSSSSEAPRASSSSAARPRPNFFKPTASSRSKLSRTSDAVIAPVAGSDSSKPRDVTLKKTRQRTRMSSKMSAMYASTPNLIQGGQVDSEDEEVDHPVPSTKIPTSNLRNLADLSRSVGDIFEVDSSTDSSTGSGPSRSTSRRSGSFVTSKNITFSLAPVDQQLMPPPPSGHLGVIRPIIKGRKSSSGNEQPTRKTSNSEMTLDQAKNILLGKSGILANGKSEHSSSLSQQTPLSSGNAQPTPSSVINSSSSLSGKMSQRTSSSSSLSTLNSGPSLTSGQQQQPPVFPPNLSPALPTPSELAVAEEIEQTANMLRHQKQANLAGILSPDRGATHPPTDLEASPLDLPERDQPSPNQRRAGATLPSQPPSSTPTPSSSSGPFQNLGTKTSFANTTFSLGKVAGDNLIDEDEVNPRTIRERIAVYQTPPEASPPPGTSAPASRRVLPASPAPQPSPLAPCDSPHSQSDTGVGSGSDTETSSHANTDRPSQPPSVSHCQNLVSDFRSQLHSLRDLVAQVRDRSDPTSLEILRVLTPALSEASDLYMATRPLDGATPTNSPSSGKHATSSSSTALHNPDIFHSAVDNISSHGNPAKEVKDSLSSARELLEPLVGQLSREIGSRLSDEVARLVREKLDRL